MLSPTVPIPLKSITVFWPQSSDQSALNRPLSMAALACDPANMTEERQREFLAENERLCFGGAAWAARILDGYDLGGAP
ncbi:MAG: hypothetical protein ABSF35_16990 [Polyangia bacterium]|jgi:hypothetical protein